MQKQIVEQHEREKSPLRLIMDRVEAGLHQMPTWHDDTLMLPNCLARSALFSCRRKIGAERIAGVVSGCGRERITAHGPMLMQGDLLVWLELIQMARLSIFGESVSITMHQLIRAMGLTNSGQRYTFVERRLQRLAETIITVEVPDGRVFGPAPLVTIESFGNGTHDRTVRYHFSPLLQNLFYAHLMTGLSRAIMHELPCGTGSWMYAYIRSHQRPFPVKLASIHSWSGSQLAMPAFHRMLLTELARLKMHHILRDFSLDGQLMTLSPMTYMSRG